MASSEAPGGSPPRRRLILASASPRRLDLLAQIGVTPDAVRAPSIDETPLRHERPRACALRLARAKAAAVPAAADEIVLAADTVVALGQRMLGKPATADEAAAFLRLLSGRRHRVVTAVALSVDGALRCRTVETVVQVKRLAASEIARYLSTEEWRGKAGGYAVQGAAAAFVPWISGSYGAVVGLPLAETLGLIEAAGYRRGGW